jgi:hypothetical protein
MAHHTTGAKGNLLDQGIAQYLRTLRRAFGGADCSARLLNHLRYGSIKPIHLGNENERTQTELSSAVLLSIDSTGLTRSYQSIPDTIVQLPFFRAAGSIKSRREA